MRIVSQSVVHSYSPMLALPAPRIAGLLPAHVGPLPKPSAEFTYHNAALTALSPERCDQLIDAVTTLLDVAVAHATGEMNDNALRASQVLFHRQLTGHSPEGPGRQAGKPTHPTAYRAERDADMLEWWAGARKRLAAGQVQS